LPAAGCTAKYQDLLRDRDSQIRELEGEVADLRAANADLERRESAARADLEKCRADLAMVPEPTNDLSRVQSELADLDVRYNRGRLSIGIENTVTFASGSTSLKPSASQVLRRVADVLKRDFADRRIYVEGHTDTDPIRRTKDRFRSNRHLSAERADVVAEYLVTSGGIDKSQVVVVGFGPYDPRDPGSSKSAKERNRRVEIVVGEPM
jgi:flagellar motor protein MotB